MYKIHITALSIHSKLTTLTQKTITGMATCHSYSSTFYVYILAATPTMESGEGDSGSTKRASASGLLLPLSQETSVEAHHGLRGDRSDSYVSFNKDCKIRE